MRGYREKLVRDLPRWREAGWVTAHGEEAILRDVGPETGGVNLAGILATLSAILLGFALMTFVASNWQDMSNVARLAVLFTSVAVCYAAAALLFAKEMPGFGHAAVLGGVSAFGASIMLIGQMYHLGGYPPHAVLMWAIGATVAGLLIRSNATLALAMILVGLWWGWEVSINNKIYWPALIGWGAVTAGFYYQRWWPGVHLSALALLAFVVHAALSGPSTRHDMNFVTGGWLLAAIGLGVVLLGIFGDRVLRALKPLSRVLAGYGAIAGFFGLFCLQFFNSVPGYGAPPWLTGMVPIAIVTLAFAICAAAWGLKTENRSLVWLGYIAFSIEILGLYFKTIGSLLNTSAFFLSVSILVALLAVIAYRLHARQQKGPEVPA